MCCRFHMYISRDSWVSIHSLLCSLMMCANIQICFGLMAVLVCLDITLPYYYQYADIFYGIKRL